MKTAFKFIFTIGFFLSICFCVEAKRGTESGGGGGVAYVGLDHPVLMDFFSIIESIDLLPSSSTDSASRIASEESIELNNENEQMIRSKNPAFDGAMTILESWSKLPLDTASTLVLRSFYSPLVWRFTDEKISAPSFYRANYLPEKAKTEVAAYYHDNLNARSFKVSVSRPVWNKLALIDQTGLLIHEALRNVQLGFGNDFSDETLQRATAIYMLCKPSGRLSYYMLFLLNNSIESADRIYGPFKTLIETSCKRVE